MTQDLVSSLFSPRKKTSLFFLLILSPLLLVQCGLPTISYLEPPTVLVSVPDGGGGSVSPPNTVVGFVTPSDDTGVVGYVLYYKVYTSEDFLSSSLPEDDEERFDPGYYTASTSQVFQPGSKVPIARHFSRVGRIGDSSHVVETVFLPHRSSWDSQPIYIDFNPNNASSPDTRDDPVAVTEYDFTNGSNLTTSLIPQGLSRGFVDPRSTVSNTKFRRFAKDWVFNTDSVTFNDGDLIRPPANGTGSNLTDFTGNSRTPFISASTGTTALYVALAVYAVGLDILTLQKFYSVPIHLGYIEYQNPISEDRN